MKLSTKITLFVIPAILISAVFLDWFFVRYEAGTHLVIAIVTLVGILYTFIGIRLLISRPLMSLVSAMEAISRQAMGKLEQNGSDLDIPRRTEVKTRDEFGQLAVLLSKMAEDLSKTTFSGNYVDNIMDSMMDTLIVVNPNGTIRTVNQATLDLLGYEKGELNGKPLGTIFATEGAFEAELMTEGSTSDVEKTYLSKGGSMIPVLFSSSVMKDGTDNVICIICTGREISDHKQAEQALAEERNLLRTLINNLPDLIYVKDTESRFIIANTAIARLMGAKAPDGLIGKTDFDFYPRELADQYYADEQEVIQSGQPLFYREEPLADQITGKRGWLSTTKVPLRDSSGEIVGIVGIGSDITEHKRTEETLQHQLEVEERITRELEEKTEELSQKNEELNAFIYTVSHDLKAPLVSLQGFSTLLMNDYGDCLDENFRMYVHRIQKNSEHMGVLIENVLDLSRIGRVRHQAEPVDISDIISDVADEFAPQLEERGTRLIMKNVMPVLWCDRTRIRRVFANLIDNASKFMGEDNEDPTIQLWCEDQDSFYTFYVRDNGIGISEEHHERVFQPFQRLGDIEAEGTGVGLTVVKKIIESFGGEVRIDSAKGKGTIIYFTIPKVERQASKKL